MLLWQLENLMVGDKDGKTMIKLGDFGWVSQFVNLVVFSHVFVRLGVLGNQSFERSG